MISDEASIKNFSLIKSFHIIFFFRLFLLILSAFFFLSERFSLDPPTLFDANSIFFFVSSKLLFVPYKLGISFWILLNSNSIASYLRLTESLKVKTSQIHFLILNQWIFDLLLQVLLIASYFHLVKCSTHLESIACIKIWLSNLIR